MANLSHWKPQKTATSLLFIMLTCACLANISFLTCLAQTSNTSKIVTRNMPHSASTLKEDFVIGKVKDVTNPTLDANLLKTAGIASHKQLVKVEIVEGPLAGKTLVIDNEITDNPAFNVNVKPGQEIVLSVLNDPGKNLEINIADYHRAPVILGLALVFFIVFLIFGGMKGLKSIMGLVLAIGLIGFVLLPASLHGFNPLISSAGICLVTASITIVAVAGFSRKSAAAFIGTFGGVIISAIAALLVITYAPLIGLSSEEAQILRSSVLTQPPAFFASLLAASMLIGALGVIMDVGVSIASAMWEISTTNTNLSKHELYTKGMNVGKDIMGSMTATLVLAYTGSALPLLLLMANTPSLKFIDLDLVATEITAALAGSLGLVCTVPLTALCASYLMDGQKQHNHFKKKAGDPFALIDIEYKKSLDNKIRNNTPAGSSVSKTCELTPEDTN